MADKVYIVEVQGKNLKEVLTQATKLNRELDKAEKPRSVGKASRAAAAALDASGIAETGLNRGATGVGGGSQAKDFARQAQGLGGLVHIYATFAANIFAVTAAFNALSKAADFSILQKSADLLSGQFGVSLNSTAKGLRAITDGAISAKQALEMTNMGATAGLSSKEIKDLGKVAKGASVALGRDLSDSMNRVFRGAIKVEPELLDELGLMVKVRDASNDYARSLGKTALELTEFERRQAFVNAVIKQGTDKYSELTQEVNPYSKLLASITDIGLKAGQGINSVIEPVIKIFSNSTAALTGALTVIVSTILKMAVPAIKNMAGAWHEANTKAVAGIDNQIQKINNAKKLKEQEAAKELKTTKQILQAHDEIHQKVWETKGIFTKGKIREIYNEFLGASGPASQDIGNKLLEKLKTQIVSAKTGISNARDEESRQKQVNRLKTLEAMQKSISSGLQAQLQHQRNIDALSEKELKRHTKSLEILEKKRKAFENISAAAKTTEALGTGAGLRELWTTTTDLEKRDKWSQRLKGSFAVLGAATTNWISKLGWAGVILGTLTALGSGLVSLFGGLTDKYDAANSAIEDLNESTKTLNTNMKALENAGSLNKIFEYSKGNAKATLESINGILAAQEKISILKGSDNWWENFKENWIPFMSQEKDFKKAATKNLSSLISSGNINKEDFNKALGGLGYEDTTTAYYSLGEGVRVESQTAMEQFVQAVMSGSESLEKLVPFLESQAKHTEKLNNAYQSLDVELKTIKDSAADFVTSMLPSTDLIKLIKGYGTASKSALDIYNLDKGNLTGIAKFIDSFTIQGQAIAGTLPQDLLKFKTSLSDLTKTLDDLKVPSKDRNILIKELINNTLNVESFVSYIISSSDNLHSLSMEAINVTKALAGISQSLRILGVFEGTFGQSGATANRKVDLQNAQVNQQAKLIERNLDTLSRMREDTVKESGFGSSAEIGSKMKELAQNKDNLAEIVRLSTIRSNLSQIDLAIEAKKAEKLAIQAQLIGKNERAALVATAEATEAAKGAEQAYQHKVRVLDLDKKLVESARNLGKITEEDASEKLRALDNEKELLDIKQEIFGTENEILKLVKSTKIAKNEAEREQAQERISELTKKLNDLTKKQTETSAIQQEEDRVKRVDENISRINKLYERNNKLIAINDAIQENSKSADLQGKIAEKIELIKNNYILINAELAEIEKKHENDEKAQQRKLEILKEQQAIIKQLTEERKKFIEEDLKKGNWEFWLEDFANKIQDSIKSAKSAASVLNEGIINSIDTTADAFYKMMQEGKYNGRELIRTLRNSLSDAFRDAASQQMKTTIKSVIDKYIGSAGSQEQILKQILSSDNAGNKLAEAFNKGTFNYQTSMVNLTDLMLKTLISIDSKTGTGSGVNSTFGSGIGGAGVYGQSPSNPDLGGGIWGWAEEVTGVFDSVGESLSSGFESILGGFFANGGIMSQYGPVKLNKYSNGGVATGPQLALYGEGKKNEAYVPLPDNRSIPVTLNGGGSSINSNVTVNVTLNTNGSESSSSTSGNEEFGKNLANMVKATVNEELIKQTRPGGLLGRR